MKLYDHRRFTEYEKAIIYRKLNEYEEIISLDGFPMGNNSVCGTFFEVLGNNQPERMNTREVLLNRLVPQEQPVYASNLKNIVKLTNIPIVELFELKDGYFWIVEGHHRVVASILAGRPSIIAKVCKNKIISSTDWR